MSFKREGDNISLLIKLKHKRVSDLLQTHIPEDEAKLLSNGRLTCLICASRPIFDTVAVLAKHRMGKKHIFELSKHIKKQQDLEMEIAKRRQMEFLKDEAINASIGSRLILEREESRLPDRRKKVLEMPHSNSTIIPFESSQKSAKSQLRKYLKTLNKKPSLEKALEAKKESYSVSSSTTSEDIKKKCVSKEKAKITQESLETAKISQESLETAKITQESLETAKISQESLETAKITQESLETAKITQESLETAKINFSKNLSGWIKNLDGTWSKDPNAEFDSDED